MPLNSNQLEKISFCVPKWKVPSYEFVAGKLKLTELEKIAYNSAELELIIAEDV